jgi:hypothetical protein
MSDVFGIRSIIYWWGFLTATVFVRDWLRQLTDFIRQPDMFVPTKIPFNMLPGLNSTIDVKTAVKFNPNQIIATIGPIGIPSWSLAILLGIILIVVGIRLYVRALRTEAWYDDFITLFILYVILRFEGHIISSTALPLTDSFKALFENQAVTFFLIVGLLLGLSFVGEGVHSKRAFWRALLAAQIISLFMFPRETANFLSYGVDALAQFGTALSLPANLPFAVAWGVVGMLLAIQRLVGSENAGGGGGHSAKRESKAEG